MKKNQMFKEDAISVVKNHGRICHISNFYTELKKYQGDMTDESYEAYIRASLQSFSNEFNTFNGQHIFVRLRGKDGYWALAENEEVKVLYNNLRNYLDKDRSSLICRECLCA